jgi:capsular polysaccharide export protein
MASRPFLRLPPFPGRRAGPLAQARPGLPCDAAELADALASARVGGDFWAAQAPLPSGRDILLAPDSQAQARAMCAMVDPARALLIGPYAASHGIPVITRLCDPWPLATAAGTIHAGAGHELALIAALLGMPLTVHGQGCFADAAEEPLATLERTVIAPWRYHDPFTGRALAATALAPLLAQWRALIDANRHPSAILGVAHWKRTTMDALLWDGSGPVRHRRAAQVPAGAPVLAWQTRTPPADLARLAAQRSHIGEIEDGMIRSAGLGANCVPPLSIIVDPLAPHFDPSRASTLETILEHGAIGPDLTARAAALRQRLVTAGISKYAQATSAAPPPPRTRRRVLVTGQVEDDRAVLLGGAGRTNRDLLARARAAEPDAELVYKTHPDVEAGHRKGHIPEAEVLAHADRVDRTSPIATLLGQIDAIHVISSLAGFEALLRGVEVVTHGVPFYAGWGLTRDLGPVPARRTRRRTLDELVAAVLILYPRYLDPVTRLPCPVEVLVERMAAGQATVTSPLVTLREWQGKFSRLTRAR